LYGTVYHSGNSGLPGDQILNMVIGPDEKIWFGTDKGIACFDGENWTSYPTGVGMMPEGAVRAMQLCISDGNLNPDDVDYINAHGTSTPYNDKNETEAIKTVFGKRAYDLAISSTKSMTGHMLGAAGAVELIASTMAVHEGKIPPTINYETPDPECDLNYTPNKAIDKEIRIAVSNTFGFGGHNACLSIKKYDDD